MDPVVSVLSAGDATRFDKGDVSFMILASALVSFMVPGLALLYSGMVRRKSALSIAWAVCAGNAVVIFQWCLLGYSLAFSSTATNGFIGNLKNFGLRGVLDAPSPGSPLIPELLFSFYQLQAACVTVGILMGAVAERGRVFPAMIFCFFWMTFVYCPLVCWIWSPNGWAMKWGVFDFAGGGPVEIGSGIGGLAYSWILGHRRERDLVGFRPHNVTIVALGTFILWFGWLGFNGGSAYGANMRSIMAIWNSTLAAAFGGITWCLLDYRIAKKLSMLGLCSGTVVGLVIATPSCGFIPPWAAILLGILAGSFSNFATKFKTYVRVDDALDLTAWHGVTGILGLMANAVFGSRAIIALDGTNTSSKGGFLDHHWQQGYKQGVFIIVAAGYTFYATALIAKTIDMIPGLQLRAPPEGELWGLDDFDIGEFANDYIEVHRDFLEGTSSISKPTDITVNRNSRAVHVSLGKVQEESHADSDSHQLKHLSLRQLPDPFLFNQKPDDGSETVTNLQDDSLRRPDSAFLSPNRGQYRASKRYSGTVH